MLQPSAGECRLCAGRLIKLAELRQPRVESLAIVPKEAPTGWRDHLELWATGLGMTVGSLVIGLLTRSEIAALVTFFGVAAFGLYQQQIRPTLVRKLRLEGGAALHRPSGVPLRGVAVQHDRTIPSPDGPALIVTTTFWLDGRPLVRDVQACSFWLEVEDRRLFIEPPLWFDTKEAPLAEVDTALSHTGAQHLPLDRKERRALTATRGAMRAGDVLAALGTIVREHRPELGSYRDATFDIMKPNGRAPLWIEPAPELDPDELASPRIT